MKLQKTIVLSILGGLLIFTTGFFTSLLFFPSTIDALDVSPEIPAAEKTIKKPVKPKYVRGIHITSWIAGSAKRRNSLEVILEETELNTLVIDIKEYDGEVHIPGVKIAQELNLYVPSITDIKDYLKTLKGKGIYTIARLVVFKDNKLPNLKPELAVKNLEGNIWNDYRDNAWLNPYSKKAWDYNLTIAEKAVELGFDEIQFDYIRFPSDGNLKTCIYEKYGSTLSASGIIVEFLKEANRRLKPTGVNLSIDVFGLTVSASNDMGIGQDIVKMAEWVDFVSPMVYPSHYAKGEYGIPNPNNDPYKTVFFGMKDARKKFGTKSEKIRPYLQDFSYGHKYGEKEVRDQIQACYDNDIAEWLLWNPRCAYTLEALKSNEFSDTYEKMIIEQEIPKETSLPYEIKPITGFTGIITQATTFFLQNTTAKKTLPLPEAEIELPKISISTEATPSLQSQTTQQTLETLLPAISTPSNNNFSTDLN